MCAAMAPTMITVMPAGNRNQPMRFFSLPSSIVPARYDTGWQIAVTGVTAEEFETLRVDSLANWRTWLRPPAGLVDPQCKVWHDNRRGNSAREVVHPELGRAGPCCNH